jgi:hypothetical protein
MFHDKITTPADGKAGPAGIRRTALAPDAISRVPAGRPARARPLESCGPGRGPPDRPTLAAGPPADPDELRAYAVQASAGRSNDSRSYSDARADKTDLHAYDGDRPKLSHRTERRVGPRLSRAQNVVGYVAAPDYSQRRVRRAVFLNIAAFFENELFCRSASVSEA